MSVETQHKDYAKWITRWQRCRDAAGGEDDVKAKQQTYLPKPSGQTDQEYLAYLKRAYWFNATARTVDGLTGLIKRKDPVLVFPPAMKQMLEDVTLSGVSFLELCSQATEEVVKVGRFGILVDYPTVDPEAAKTLADEQAAGVQPFCALYEAEDIINWRIERAGARTRLTLVVLCESYLEPAADDEFAPKTKKQYRVLDLIDGKYRQRIFRQVGEDSSSTWAVVTNSEVYPQLGGKPFDHIPFFFCGVGRSDGKIESPPIYDLANVNLSHYRTMADLENGAHWSGVPTPVITGVADTTKEIALGSTTAIVLQDPNAKAFFLEIQGTFGALEKRAEVKENEMALLGARILSPEKKATETAETAAIHRAGENSVLASIAVTISHVLSEVLDLMRTWAGIPEAKCSATLNTDFLAMQMSPAMLIALVGAVQAGRFTMPDFFTFLQKSDVVPSSETYQKFMADLESQAPFPTPAAGGATMPGGGAGGGKLE